MIGLVVSLTVACVLTLDEVKLPEYVLIYVLNLVFLWILVSIEDVLWILR